MDWPSLLVAGFAVLFIGVAKAGFGGGLGMLATPLCVLAFGPKTAIGILLPLLCAGDAFSLYHYWGKWRAQNLKFLLPGVVAGVMLGVRFIGHFSPRQLNVAIGLIAVLFAAFQFARDRIFQAEGAFAPNHRVGLPCGIGMGITSTFAHSAGPLAAMFLRGPLAGQPASVRLPGAHHAGHTADECKILPAGATRRLAGRLAEPPLFRSGFRAGDFCDSVSHRPATHF